MPHQPTPHENSVILAARTAQYWLEHKWAIPMLLALWRGPMSRNQLFEAVGTYRPESNLTPTMFSRTAQHLEDNRFVVISRSPGHPDTQEGATYTITDQARTIIPPLRDALLLFAEQAASSNGHRPGDTAHRPDLAHGRKV